MANFCTIFSREMRLNNLTSQMFAWKKKKILRILDCIKSFHILREVTTILTNVLAFKTRAKACGLASQGYFSIQEGCCASTNIGTFFCKAKTKIVEVSNKYMLNTNTFSSLSFGAVKLLKFVELFFNSRKVAQ